VATSSQEPLIFLGSHACYYSIVSDNVSYIVFGGGGSTALRTTHPLFLRTSAQLAHASLSLSLWLKEHPLVTTPKPRWACIHANYATGIDACEAFKLGYGAIGEEVGRVPVPFKTVNKKLHLMQLADLQPEFAMSFFSGTEARIFIQDYYRFALHTRIPLVTAYTAVTNQLLHIYAQSVPQYGTAVGVLSAAHWVEDLPNAENQKFIALYQQAYSDMPSLYALHGYDTGRLLIRALAQLHGVWHGAQVVQLMKTLPLNSPRDGTPLRFDTHGDAINPGYIFMIERHGKRLVKNIIGTLPPINMDTYFP